MISQTSTVSHMTLNLSGEIHEYSANIIVENMYSQVDANGHSYALLNLILDFSKDAQAVEKATMHIYTKSRQRQIRKTTIG